MTDVADPLILPRARPGDVGLDASGVLGLLDALDTRGLELHSLMVLRHGRVAVEGWWAPYTPDRVHLLYSLSKSFTSTAVGFCVSEGRLGLGDTVVSLLPDHVPDDVAQSVAGLTVHHLLSMSTGHSHDTLGPMIDLEPADAVRGFLRIPPEEPVGSRHVYNNGTTYVLAAIVEQATGMPLLDYLRPRLFDPLGISRARWSTDAHGQAMGLTGLHLQTESVAAFGQLLLQDGRWHGKQVLPPGWVSLATTSHIGTDDPGDDGAPRPVDWRQGYGYQYWRSRHGFRGDGHLGQLALVVPELELVVATTAHAVDMQAVLDAVWTHLLPAVSEDEGTSAARSVDAEQELAERLGSLALPTVGEPREPTDLDHRRVLTGVVGPARDSSPFAPGTRVSVAPDGDDALVTLQRGGLTLSFPCGRSAWAEGRLGTALDPLLAAPGGRAVSPNEPTSVVSRGRWTGVDRFEADLVLIETPHRVRLRLDGSRAQAEWNSPPLSGSRVETQLPGGGG